MATFNPSIRPNRSRIVYRSSKPCVGCSCAPSPALTMLHLTVRGQELAEPAAAWRMTIMSTPIASMLRAVSISVSPLLTLLTFSEKSIMSAERRDAASEKLVRVRVLSSKKALTTTRPQQRDFFHAAGGDFLEGVGGVENERFPQPTVLPTRAGACESSRVAVAVSATAVMSGAPRRLRLSRRSL